MATIRVDGATILIETDLITAQVQTEGYVSGVKAGSLVDKTTGARDLGFGLDITDFLLEPLADIPGETDEPYTVGDAYHGGLVKRYVELPQICTGARRLEFDLFEGDGWVAVRQWYHYQQATYGRRPGSLWEQTLVFRDGLRYFISADRITSANAVAALTFRLDMPGHLKHDAGDSFTQIYLSYETVPAAGRDETLIPAAEFVHDFPPDARYLYQRGRVPLPARMIRAYQVRHGGQAGPWLAGMTLQPRAVAEAWCHQRGYVCFIEEIGGLPVAEQGTFGAAYIVGWFEDIAAMHSVYDAHRGASELTVGTDVRLA